MVITKVAKIARATLIKAIASRPSSASKVPSSLWSWEELERCFRTRLSTRTSPETLFFTRMPSSAEGNFELAWAGSTVGAGTTDLLLATAAGTGGA